MTSIRCGVAPIILPNFALHEHAGWSYWLRGDTFASNQVILVHLIDEMNFPAMTQNVAVYVQKHNEWVMRKQVICFFDPVVETSAVSYVVMHEELMYSWIFQSAFLCAVVDDN